MENKSLDIFIKKNLEDFEVDIPQDWAFMEDMLDAEEVMPVDEAAKVKLRETEVPFEASGWLAMEAALDDLDVNDVDEAAKSALEDFQVKYNPADWAIMGAILDAETPEEIDDVAKSALQNYAAPFVPMDWEMMDEALDDAGFPNEIDEAAKAALQQFNATQPSNWAAMESILAEVEQIRRQLIITKSIELFLFIFAIWTIGNFLPFKQKSSKAAVYPIENIIEIENNNVVNATEENQPQADKSFAPKINNLSIFNQSSENNFDNNINSSSGNIEIGNNLNARNLGESFELDIPTFNNINSIPPIENNRDTKVSAADKPIAAVLIPRQTKEVLVTYPTKKGKTFKNNNLINNLNSNNVIVGLNNANFVERKTFDLNDDIDQTLDRNYSINKESRLYRVRMKISVSPEYGSFVNTQESYNNRKITSGFATSLGVDYAISKKVEVSSGISYNRKSYIQRTQSMFVNTYNPFSLEEVKKVNLSLIQVPVRMNYNIKKDDNIRLYSIIGITAGLVMKAVSNTQEALLAGSFLIRDTNTQDNLTVDNYNNRSSLTEGILQNGEINTSAFVTADVGLGLEYQASRRFSFFIEPLFQRSINKIGRNKETYKNYSLALGSRIIL